MIKRRTPRAPTWLSVVVFCLVAAVWLSSTDFGPAPAPYAPPGTATETPGPSAETPSPEASSTTVATTETSTTESKLVIPDVTIKDQSGRVVFRGAVDLAPTLERIERGERHPHRNDGGTFRNLEGRLPKQRTGYYKEYVHPTPGLDGPGPQRVILGQAGEVFYTADHYQSFRRIR